MKIILVIVAFFMAPDGSLRRADTAKAIPFDTMEQCNYVGNNIENYYRVPEGASVITVCVNVGNVT